MLRVGLLESGDPDGVPVVLLHGFPYDVRAYDEVAPVLADAGCRVIVPYLRGFGPTEFLRPDTMRSGQQAALGQDLLELLDTLDIDRAVVAGYDWGGRAACTLAALWPERVRGLISVDGYNIQDIAHAMNPASPAIEATYWYQYLLHSERGRRLLSEQTAAFCELLWRQWSPTWAGASAAFAASLPSLHNPDFVATVVHSYRHRFGLIDGDPRYDATEALLAGAPSIGVPTTVITTDADGVGEPPEDGDITSFTGAFTHLQYAGIGHNVPQEAPDAFAEAVLAHC